MVAQHMVDLPQSLGDEFSFSEKFRTQFFTGVQIIERKRFGLRRGVAIGKGAPGQKAERTGATKPQQAAAIKEQSLARRLILLVSCMHSLKLVNRLSGADHYPGRLLTRSYCGASSFNALRSKASRPYMSSRNCNAPAPPTHAVR